MVALQLKQSTTCNSRARDSEIGSTSRHVTPDLSQKELQFLLSPCSYGLPTGEVKPVVSHQHWMPRFLQHQLRDLSLQTACINRHETTNTPGDTHNQGPSQPSSLVCQ
ncbi:hypothetical protein DPX16_4539 [Anabarilius grahami]|uniref:Uncharacterized protein n=1 Tax=Anabarilius grahami TaxID=495550 RepID=A0A3N0XHF7_ANAGA|nr:hypothetical protein DPX16_4539 [Anabarilius grahami]